MIYWRDKSLIRKRYREWLSPKEIQKKFPRKIVTENEIWVIVKTRWQMERRIIDWIEHLRCNTCKNLKPFNYENFQNWQTKCRRCRNLIRTNKRKIDRNMWIWPKPNVVWWKRRWIRTLIKRILDIKKG